MLEERKRRLPARRPLWPCDRRHQEPTRYAKKHRLRATCGQWAGAVGELVDIEEDRARNVLRDVACTRINRRRDTDRRERGIKDYKRMDRADGRLARRL
jgi:hypothetical protein